MSKLFKIKTIYGGEIKGYLFYVIGETLLVVFSILIAVNVNNWNIKNKNLELEQTYIEGLREDIKQDTLFFSLNYFNNIKHKKKALNKVKDYINGDYEIKDTLQFIKEVGYAGRYSQLAIAYNNSSYIELLSTGKFRILTSKALRKKIIEYNTLFENSLTTINNQRTGYAEYINSLRPFDRSNPDQINQIDRDYMLKNLRNKKMYELINQELTYANNLESFASNVKEKATELLGTLNNASNQKTNTYLFN